MLKLSVVVCAVLLVLVVCADEKLKDAQGRCWSSVTGARRELTEKHDLLRSEFNSEAENEAVKIHENGLEELDSLVETIFKAKTMELTTEVTTSKGTIINCSKDIALAVSEITKKVFVGLDKLHERVTDGKEPVLEDH